MDADSLAFPTLVAAIISAVLAALGIAVVLILRFRDRIDLRVSRIEPAGDHVRILVRNHGGGPTEVQAFVSDQGRRLDMAGGLPKVPGRSDADVSLSIAHLAREWPSLPPLCVVDSHGRRSSPRPFPPTVHRAVQEHIRISPP